MRPQVCQNNISDSTGCVVIVSISGKSTHLTVFYVICFEKNGNENVVKLTQSLIRLKGGLLKNIASDFHKYALHQNNFQLILNFEFFL